MDLPPPDNLRYVKTLGSSVGCSFGRGGYRLRTEGVGIQVTKLIHGRKEAGMQLKPVGDQVVVLMGASSGIGRQTALRFAREGAKVVASARSEAGLRSLVQGIRAEGGEATAVVADTSEFGQVQAVADKAVQEYGRLDTWVHLAAAGLFARFDQTQPEEFARVVEVDLMGQVYGAMSPCRT
jgi:hypothetical protein